MTTPAERLAAYRSKHLIDLQVEEHPDFGRIYRCGVDGIRVHSTRNGRFYHDPGELKTLLDANYGGPWGTPKEIVVEDRGAYVVTVDEDEEWDNREGMPEFNGSFR